MLVAPNLPEPCMFLTALCRAEYPNEACDARARHEKVGIRLIEPAGRLLRAPSQRRFIKREELAISKHGAAADHDPVDRSAVLTEDELNQRRAQGHEICAFQLKENDVGL